MYAFFSIIVCILCALPARAADTPRLNLSAGIEADSGSNISLDASAAVHLPRGKLYGTVSVPLHEQGTETGSFCALFEPAPWCTVMAGSAAPSGTFRRLYSPEIPSALYPLSASGVTQALPDTSRKTTALRPAGIAVHAAPQLYVCAAELTPFASVYADETAVFAAAAGISYEHAALAGSVSAACISYTIEHTGFDGWFTQAQEPLPAYLERTRFCSAAIETTLSAYGFVLYAGAGAAPSVYGGLLPWLRAETRWQGSLAHIRAAASWVPRPFAAPDGGTVKRSMRVSCTPLVRLPLMRNDAVLTVGAAVFAEIYGKTGKCRIGADFRMRDFHIRCTAGWSDWPFAYTDTAETSFPLNITADAASRVLRYSVSFNTDILCIGTRTHKQTYGISFTVRPISTAALPAFIPETRVGADITAQDDAVSAWNIAAKCTWKIRSRYAVIRLYAAYEYAR